MGTPMSEPTNADPNQDPDGDDPRADLRWGTIAAAVQDAVARGEDKEAIVDGDRNWTWAQLGSEIDRAAKAFMAAGIEIGDRVAIWAPNCGEWVVALLGLQSAGGVLVPLNTRYKGAEAADILGRSRAKILVSVDGFLGNHYVGMLEGEDLPHLEQILLVRTDESDPIAASATRWEDFLSSQAAGEVTDEELDSRRAEISPSSVADLLFTSGTTGKPKGVICTNEQTLRTVGTWANVVGLNETDRYLAINPFFHSFGYKAGIIAWLVTGGVLVPMPVFDVPEAMRLIAEQAITMLPGPPTLYQTILNHPDRAELDSSSLRLAVTGAASVPVSLVEQMRTDLGFNTVITAYGLTEGCGFATMCRRSDSVETIATTSGRAMPGIEVRVAADNGEEMPAGEAGEVLVRGYNVMKAYFENPQATAETIDSDGWLHTGDVGVMDNNGYLRITDRIKDLFIVGGFNAYPAEIENLLLNHPMIAQVAVVGVADERMGEVGAAFVVAVDGTNPQPDEIVAWAREHMANYKVPRHVQIVDALPFNPGGKVMKFVLRDQLAAAEEAR